jgi:predicted nucleic acid-binding protein
MKPNWVFDASPLIVLGKADLLSTISPLAENWIIPESVVKEVSRKGDIDLLLSKLSEDSRVERQTVAIEPLVANWNLGNGESEVITLAVKNSEYGVILPARKCAKILNLPLIGSLGLVVKAKKEGLLEFAKPAFDKLVASGLYLDMSLIKNVLSSIGE